jgi:hypothetical protein
VDLAAAGELLLLGLVLSAAVVFAAGLGLGVAALTTSAKTKLDKRRAIVFVSFMRVLSMGNEEGLVLRVRGQTGQTE